MRILAAIIFLACLSGQVFAAVSQPRRDEPYRTVWDRIMAAQSYRNMAKGLVLMEMGRYGDAASEFGRSVTENANDPWPHIMLGSALYWAGQVDQAVTEYNEALRIDPQNAHAWQLMGIASAWKGDQQGALSNFIKAEQFAPDRPDVQMNLGSIYQSLGQLDKALSCYRRAVDLDERSPLYRFQLGMLYSSLGRDEAAAESLEKAVSLYPSYQDAILELGAVYERMDKIKNAHKSYKKAVSLKPMDSVARLRLAAVLIKEGKPAEAREALERAFNLVPVDKSEGLALSVSYAGVSSSSGAGQDGEQSDKEKNAVKNTVDKLKKNLERLSPEETANITVEVIYMPKEQPKLEQVPADEGGALGGPGKKGGALASAFKKAAAQPQAMGIKREFSLQPASPGERRRQIEAVAKELGNALDSVPQDSQLHMALSVETSKGGGEGRGQPREGGGGPSSSNAKVAYNPRLVGNDLGLWVKGMSWLELVKEVLPSLNENAADNPERLLAQGLAHVILGEPEQAGQCFERAAALGDKSSAYLGLAVSSVVLGDESAAVKYCEKVLETDPGNEIAKTNLKWLKTPSSVSK
ncbi:MAG: tetratricopeptide repeat protein [Elusimicrobia bacterium]|nr:tetratricopeptide repeat protein [Elusimicrobiota bacterium]